MMMHGLANPKKIKPVPTSKKLRISSEIKKMDLPCPRALEYKNAACVSFTVRAAAVFMQLDGFKWHLVFLKRII
jgi:CII-binding regulator of phage lambda lysogenization HflD